MLLIDCDGRHATLLDAQAPRVVYRFQGRFDSRLDPALGPLHAPDGRSLYAASKDGWVTKLGLLQLTSQVGIRAGLETQGIALSDDGRTLIVGNRIPRTLVLLDAATLALRELIQARDGRGRSSPVTAVRPIARRSSFAVAFGDLPEVWEISYRIPPPPGFGHWTHDHRAEGGDATTFSPFPIRRLRTNGPLQDLYVAPNGVQMIGTVAPGAAEILDLDLGRTHGWVELPRWPRLDAAVTWQRGDTRVIAAPNRRGGGLTTMIGDCSPPNMKAARVWSTLSLWEAARRRGR